MATKKSGSGVPWGGNESNRMGHTRRSFGFWGTSESCVGVDGRARNTYSSKICNNSSHSVQHQYCGIRSTLGTPTGQLLHHAISFVFRIHFFDATLICLAFVDISAVYLTSRRTFPPRRIVVSREASPRSTRAHVRNAAADLLKSK